MRRTTPCSYLLRRDLRYRDVEIVLGTLGFRLEELCPSVFPARPEPRWARFRHGEQDEVWFRYLVDPDRRFVELDCDDQELREVFEHRLGFASVDEVLKGLRGADEAEVFAAAFELVALIGPASLPHLSKRLIESPGEHAEHGIVRAIEALGGREAHATLCGLAGQSELRPQTRLLLRLACEGQRG